MEQNTQSNVKTVVVGVDVGGTNTDAVVLSRSDNSSEVIGAVKETTSADVTSGVRRSVLAALKQATDKGYELKVRQVNIGTTHFVNAAVQGKGLAKVSVIRLCGTAAKSLPPFSDFPSDLREIICGTVHLCSGGYRFDGTEIGPIDRNEIADVINEIKDKGIKNIVLSGIFSPVKPEQENRVCDIIKEAYPQASVTLSHRIGQIGLLERENAAILNESLKPLCRKTIEGFRDALESINLNCPVYLTQNDGTVISSENAISYPVCTFASGPTNSMRGAAFLSEVKDAIVLDIGGTTTDVGVLKNRFPREASTQVKIGRVRTNFRMPDVLSIGLGGGSYVQEQHDKDGKLTSVSIGPLSAGYNLKNEALIFGSGSDETSRKLTTTDIAVAAGLLKLGNPQNVSSLPKALIDMTLTRIVRMIEDAIDMVKLSGETLPVILVGGGSVLVDKTRTISGASEVIIPENSGVANAIGAALSQVSGSVDSVVSLQNMVDKDQMERAMKEAVAMVTDDPTGHKALQAADKARKPFFISARDSALSDAICKARETAIAFGAAPESLGITEKEDITVSYIPGQATRIKIKVVGDLQNFENSDKLLSWKSMDIGSHTDDIPSLNEKQMITSTGQVLMDKNVSQDETKIPKEPYIEPDTGHWVLSEYDIEAIVIGAGIFGCGGGGNPHLGRLRALAEVRKGKRICIVSPEKLYQTADPQKDVVVPLMFMGAPLIWYEQLVSTAESKGAYSCVQDLYTVGGYKDGDLQNRGDADIKTLDGVKYIENYVPEPKESKRFVALMAGEIGGMNAIEPLLVSADLGLPVVDADCMGRAFPELQMFTPYMHGLPPFPAALVDDKGRRAALLQAPSPVHLEKLFRDICVDMGCAGGLAISPLNKSEIMTTSVLYSFSHAWCLGDTVLRARHAKESPVKAILKAEESLHILTGRIRDVLRETSGGFTKGRLIIEGVDDFAGVTLLVEFQNEFLIIFPLSEDRTRGEPMATVPDLITIVDEDTAEPIPTEEVKYGMRVAVLVLACQNILRNEEALRYVGPKAFNYDVDFRPIGEAYPIRVIPPRY